MNRPRRTILARLAQTVSGVALAAALGFGLLPALTGGGAVSAALAPSKCTGNVCTDVVLVGGSSVAIAWTQHLSPAGELRVRFNGGPMATASLISHIVTNLPAFASWNKLANPTNGAVFLPTETVNPGYTAYERRDADGCASCIVDEVLSVKYSALAAGVYTFDLLVVQNNASALKTGLTFYVDGTAPSNMNESTPFGFPIAVVPNMDYPCADASDNDVDYRADCADLQCVGSIGKVATGARCEAPEQTCNDLFDNDADGLVDCKDPDCNGRVGDPAVGGTARCQYGNETGAGFCVDNFDNDADGETDCVDHAWTALNGGTANSICWKKLSFGCPDKETSCSNNVDDDKDLSYDDAWDANPLTGVDCKDYDCAGNPNCPAFENKLKDGTEADDQCFNTIDDDLDHKIDCADPDCLGIVDPNNPLRRCVDKEFDLGQHYQYCANQFDDDGDTPIDCDDSDCKQKFGNCGPCPSVEAIAYDSCADGKDNDTDVAKDCADTDCAGQLGATPLAAMCLAAEGTATACVDGFDNDLDLAIDCADTQCAGQLGPLNQSCQPLGETTCSDGADNDGDGYIDCADTNCFGVGSCAAKTWVDATCVAVPHDAGPAGFTSNSPTVFATYRDASRVSSTDVIRVTGSATYSAISLIIGDNTQPATYYPYASVSGCTLRDTVSGLPSATLGFTGLDGRYIYVFHKVASVAPFDVTLTCPTPATPNALRNYPLNLLAGRAGAAEYGIIAASNTLYEGTKPTLGEFEPEGEAGGTMRVPYGATPAANARRIRGVPNDPGVPPNASGICKCDVTVNGAASVTTPDCTTAPITFQMDGVLALSGTATDGAANVSNNFASSFALNVTPVEDVAFTVMPSKPFLRTGSMLLEVDARFLTGSTDTFSTCGAYVYTPGGALLNGPVGPSYSFPGIAGAGNAVHCSGSLTLPAGASDGTYTVHLRVVDSDGDYVNSNKQAFYICNAIPAAGSGITNGCQFADFDRDGASEGLYSTPPMYSPTPLACDNCENMYNPGQKDENANGIGDDCEPEDNLGRCEVDTDLVCKYHSNNAAKGCPAGAFCCPGPSIADDAVAVAGGAPAGTKKDPQFCKQNWCVCSFDGKIAFAHEECTAGGAWGTPAVPAANAGYGKCTDGTRCKIDNDCVGKGEPEVCSGANYCSNSLNAWLQTQQGSIFSKKRISAEQEPPAGQYNASFCILAKELVLKFTTAQCGVSTDSTVKFERPKQSNAYTSVLGKVDVAGLRARKYGFYTPVSGSLDAALDMYASNLGGRVFHVVGDATLNVARTFRNGGGGAGAGASGAGTILVDGGDLYINAELGYEATAPATLETLASLGVIMVPAADGSKGNVYVKGDVHGVVGAYYVGGADGFWTVAPPDTDSPEEFTLSGLAVAKSFHLSRSYRSKTQGAERFLYDGRAVANPPPGFADVTKSLPLFTDSLQ